MGENLGEILKKERIKHKLTLREAAQDVTCSHNYIKRIEDGLAKDNKFVTVINKLCFRYKIPKSKRLKILQMCPGE